MSESFSTPVILDATVLSNFASTDTVPWLTTVLDHPHTVPAVRAELEEGYNAGYEFLGGAVEAIEAEFEIAETAPKVLREDHLAVRDRLDAGEAEALAAALTADGTLGTDDGPARTVASEYNTALTGSIGLLVRGVVLEELTVEMADTWLTTWIQDRNYFSPVDSVAEALPPADETEIG